MRMLLWENLRLGPVCRDDVLFGPSHTRPLWTRARTVVTTHDMLLQIRPDRFRHAWFYDRLYEWSARHAVLVITDSEASREEIHRIWNIPLDRIRTVYLAASESFFPCDDAPRLDAARLRAVGQDAPFFLFVGKMSGRRDLSSLIEAYALFRRTNHPHKLVLVGPKPQHFDVDALCHRLGVAEHVRILGYVPDEELNLLYNATAALVMPSVYETVSLPVMEAQAVGAPVVCIDTPGMRENTGGAASMTSKLDPQHLLEAMLHVVEDEAFRDTIKAGAIIHARKFSWARCARETMAVLADAAAMPPSRG